MRRCACLPESRALMRPRRRRKGVTGLSDVAIPKSAHMILDHQWNSALRSRVGPRCPPIKGGIQGFPHFETITIIDQKVRIHQPEGGRAGFRSGGRIRRYDVVCDEAGHSHNAEVSGYCHKESKYCIWTLSPQKATAWKYGIIAAIRVF